jgi:hypothetical protein
MRQQRIQLPWKQSLVKKPWLKKITLTYNFWRDLSSNSFLKGNTSQEDCMTLWIWHGSCFLFILKKAYQKYHNRLSKNITRRD